MNMEVLNADSVKSRDKYEVDKNPCKRMNMEVPNADSVKPRDKV